MPQTQTVALHKRPAIGVKAIELKKQGSLEEVEKMKRQILMTHYLAKWAKKCPGADFFIKYGWNLSEANTLSTADPQMMILAGEVFVEVIR
jgi:hypothetical protein